MDEIIIWMSLAAVAVMIIAPSGYYYHLKAKRERAMTVRQILWRSVVK